MKNRKRNSYNNGVALVVIENSKQTSFSAKMNSKTMNDFTAIGRLFYSEETRRHEDMLFAESMNHSLTLKIKTGYVDWVKSKHKVIIGNYIYDIIHVDSDVNKREIYIYLEGVRELGTDDQGQN